MNTSRRIVYLLLLFTTIFLTILQPIHAEEKSSPVTELDYGIITGEWQRTDGSYRIRISGVQVNGQVTVEYFNPSPIHVEHAVITTRKGLIKLFIQLQDTGYEGSTYTLYYYKEKNALAGFYYQAVMDTSYEVIFLRKNG